MQNQKIEGAKEAMLDTNGPPFGAAPGGVWKTEQYSGMVTMIIFIVLLFVGVLFCWAPFCCPCELRQPTGIHVCGAQRSAVHALGRDGAGVRVLWQGVWGGFSLKNGGGSLKLYPDVI